MKLIAVHGAYPRPPFISILSVTLTCESNEQATEKTSFSLRERTAPRRIFGSGRIIGRNSGARARAPGV
jgi:hypothetical protein